MLRSRLLFGLCLIGIVTTTAWGQVRVNVSTGYDQDGEVVLTPAGTDDDYTVVLVGGVEDPIPASTCADAWPIQAGVWMLNDDQSLWIGLSPLTTEAAPGTYDYEIRFFLPEGGDAPKAVLTGAWATDDGGMNIIINGTPTGLTGGGFGAFTPIPADAGIGLFLPGENSIIFQVSNGGTAANPTGLRVAAFVEVPLPVTRVHNVSTGFDEGAQALLDDGAADITYTVTGPDGSGIGPVDATAINDDGFPIPPWVASSVNSRWVGVAADGVGPAGLYRFVTRVTLPTGFDASLARLDGGVTADDSLEDIVINGTSTGITSTDYTKLAPFSVFAGQGLFHVGENTIEFVVLNGTEGETGLRVDAEVTVGPVRPDALTGILALDTGYDEASRGLIGNAFDDDNWTIIGPAGSDIAQVATVANDNAWPITAGVWIVSSARSKWISPQADTNGPAGLYTFEIDVDVPEAYDPSSVRMVGGWATDNNAIDVLVNGVSTGLTNAGNFTVLQAFPPDAGLGLFQAGENTISFQVLNIDAGPVGLRVEGSLGIEEPRAGDISTGIGTRGEGPLPAGFEDMRYAIVGPDGSGIGPQLGVVLSDASIPVAWTPNSTDSKWIGLDAQGSSGPAGTYVYTVLFDLPRYAAPFRTALVGRWWAANSGTIVTLNGTTLDVEAAGPGAFSELTEAATLGLLVTGVNQLEFRVENSAAGQTGLRVEAALATTVENSALDISTGFDEFSGVVGDQGTADDEWLIVPPDAGQTNATIVLSPPFPAWIQNTSTSAWIGTEVLGGNGPPGVYAFATTVELTADEAAEAYIVGSWACDDNTTALLVNGVATGVVGGGDFTTLSPIPADTGKGLFQTGENTIEFVVENATPDVPPLENPVGLRVDAIVRVPSAAGGARFSRGNANGDANLNITDGIYVLNYLFLGGPTPPCLEAANANGDEQINITDGIFILNFLFLGGTTPPAPFPGCGPDPTPANATDCAASTEDCP